MLNRFTVIGSVMLIIMICTGFYINGLNGDIEDRDVIIKNLTDELDNKTLEVALNKTTIDQQRKMIEASNIEVEKYRVNNEKVAEELQNWKDKPPIIKYKHVNVVKFIKESKKTSGDLCKDLKDTVESLRRIRIEDI